LNIYSKIRIGKAKEKAQLSQKLSYVVDQLRDRPLYKASVRLILMTVPKMVKDAVSADSTRTELCLLEYYIALYNTFIKLK